MDQFEELFYSSELAEGLFPASTEDSTPADRLPAQPVSSSDDETATAPDVSSSDDEAHSPVF